MILLWMDGGPSQYDTFNPKPGSEYQGPAQAIDTNCGGHPDRRALAADGAGVRQDCADSLDGE